MVCGEQFEDEVLLVFSTLKITGYTVIHGVGGSGVTGEVSVMYTKPSSNKLFLVALEDERMNALVEAIHQLQTRLVQEKWGLPRHNQSVRSALRARVVAVAEVVIDIGPTGDENDRRVRQADRNPCCSASSNR